MSRPLAVRTGAILPQYAKFWPVFDTAAAALGARYRTASRKHDNWRGWSLGGMNVMLCARATLSRNDAMVLVSIPSKVRDECFTLLKHDQEAIERRVGLPLVWNDTKKEARIGYSWPVPLHDPQDWPTAAAQILETLRAFDAAFRPHIERMSPGATTP